jgi:hypothetical protein
MPAQRVETIIDGQRQVHMVGGPHDYDTACAIDMNDPDIGNFPENIKPTKDKIDCASCIRIWQDAKKYKPSDFKVRP